MTEAEKIVREKAVWIVVGGIQEIMSHRIPASLFGRGEKFLAAIMPLEEAGSAKSPAPGRGE